MTLFKRILIEKRAVAIPLVLALLVNIGVYVLVVHPLAAKSANEADRAANATAALKVAQRDLTQAQALVGGKSRADQELATFYDKVLPGSQSEAAWRLLYARIPKLSQKTNVKFEKRDTEPDKSALKDARYGRVKTRVVFQGEYENIRQLIYELESAPEFVIIDAVTLAQSETNKPLTLTVELSTYYRL
jgi:type II secretion system (T2SS) protein M